MRANRYLERLDQAVWLSRILQLLSLALAIAVLVLARQRTIVHVVPAALTQDYRVGATFASREYLEQMAAFLATTALTVNPDNAEFAARGFMKYLSPEARGRLEPILLGEASYIKTNSLTQAFYPKSIDFFSPKRLRITGTLVQWVGGKVVTQRDTAYNLTFEVQHYALVIRDFEHHEQTEPAPVVRTAPLAGPADAAPAGEGR